MPSIKTEPINNIGYVCSEHAPKAGKYIGQDPKAFIGKFVKLAFDDRHGKTKEHMWVKVVDFYDESKGELRGVLDNDPVYDVGYECGDELAFEVHEIEDVDG